MPPSNDNDRSFPRPQTRGPGGAGWFAIFVLAGFLLVAVWYAVHAWTSLPDTGISIAGWLFLGLGVVVTFLVGAGLMALLFISSRRGKDF